MGSPWPSDLQAPVLAEERVMANVVTPYQTVHFTLTSQNLNIDWTRSFLGVVPVGESSLAVPLTDLQEMRMSHTVIPPRLVLALALGALPFVVETPRWLVGFVMVLAIWMLLVSVIGAVKISHGASRTVIPVCLLQKHAVEQFVEEVWQVVSTRREAEP